MKPGGIKRIIKEDFPPEVQKWIDTLLYPLNQNVEQTKLILDNNLTFQDNVLASIRTLTLEGTSLLIANSTANSNVLTSPSYYQATIDEVIYGIQPNLKVDGEGVLPDTLIATVGTNITLSLPVQYTQTKGEFIVGGSFPFKVAHGLTVRPSVVTVVKIEDTAVLKAPLARGIFAQWDTDGDTNIVIKAITGLQAGKRYKITFLIF